PHILAHIVALHLATLLQATIPPTFSTVDPTGIVRLVVHSLQGFSPSLRVRAFTHVHHVLQDKYGSPDPCWQRVLQFGMSGGILRSFLQGSLPP
ncbi:hypothetical protein BGW80DRAFT_1424419, partial [Lactifluus volemus]